MRARVTSLLLLCLAAAGQNPPPDLFQSVRDNDLASLKSRLASGADVNARDARGNTLLMQAAVFGSVDAAKLLLDAGADVNAKNSFDATALLRGANDLPKTRLLVEHGAHVNAASKQGRTPLMVAATCDGCVENVRLLIAKGADVKARDGHGSTALYSAVEASDLETARLLVEHGASASAGDDWGWTPLMSAANKCNAGMVRYLLSKGADVNAANNFSGEVKFGKIQLNHLTPLMNAAPYCSMDAIQPLLEAGARVNEKDGRDMTPLMFAVASEHQDVAVVKSLLKAGAEVNVKSNVGETALDWAAKFGNPKVIAALKEAGAQPGAPFTPPERKAIPARTPAEASQVAMALLQRTSTQFFTQSGCVGCHHQPMTTAAFAVAKTGGVPADESAGRQHIKMMESEWTRSLEPVLERAEGGGFTDPPAFELLALHRAGYAPNGITDALALYIAGAQLRGGMWIIDGASRSPIQEGAIGRAAQAARAMQLYCPPAHKAEFDARIVRTRNWLVAQAPSTNDDYAMRLLGLYWFGAGADKVKSAATALLATQRADGGWGQNPNLPSDAYATGESLSALRDAGVLQVADAAYRRGVKFLLGTQWDDGSWYVRSRAVKLQPYFQSGFPFDHDQWISSAGTAYAVMALAAK